MTRWILAPLLALGLAAPVAAPVFASSGERCDAPIADWQPREALEKKLTAEGMDVRRIKTDDGCYEVKAIDAKGRRIEAYYDPKTLELVKYEREEDDD